MEPVGSLKPEGEVLTDDEIEQNRLWLTARLAELTGASQPSRKDSEFGHGDMADQSSHKAEAFLEQSYNLTVVASRITVASLALLKIQKGTYQVCERCGHPIPKVLLLNCPSATTHMIPNWDGKDRSQFSTEAKACSDYGPPVVRSTPPPLRLVNSAKNNQRGGRRRQ